MITKEGIEELSDERIIENCKITAEEDGLTLDSPEAIKYVLEGAIYCRSKPGYIWTEEEEILLNRLLEVLHNVTSA